MKNVVMGILSISISQKGIVINEKYHISTSLLKKIWLIQFIIKQLLKIILIMFILK